ncbi:MAG: site-specific integrase [Clostridiales bacterium]|jgi:site-specific recombinase XerD|nr:site-specific integrase [Clostridiales bacterium]
MTQPDFGECVTAYLTMYLPGELGLSANTIAAYSCTFQLIIQYAEEKCGLIAEKMTFKDFNSVFVVNFLSWLENERGCSIATRNQRLTSIRAFAKYARKRNPGYLGESQKIADIKTKKKPKPLLAHLSADNIQEILSQADTQDDYGRRDMVLLSLMYDSAARVQEICDLCVSDIRLEKPYVVLLTRKPNGKRQAVPIMESTVDILAKYLRENRLDSFEKSHFPLFFNHQRGKLTRAGIAYILKKYCDLARKENPAIPSPISPHVFRHSKAMHMLQAGINLVYIRDFLGHEHVETTEIYAKADTEMKRKAIENAQITIDPDLPDWAGNKPLMQLLTKLCNKK